MKKIGYIFICVIIACTLIACSKKEKPQEETTKIDNLLEMDKERPKDAPNAEIKLLSGDTVTISCSSEEYIVSTRTDTIHEKRDGEEYEITKLIITFNTGEERVLETIEKKIN